jgi:hypothetical protein
MHAQIYDMDVRDGYQDRSLGKFVYSPPPFLAFPCSCGPRRLYTYDYYVVYILLLPRG